MRWSWLSSQSALHTNMSSSYKIKYLYIFKSLPFYQIFNATENAFVQEKRQELVYNFMRFYVFPGINQFCKISIPKCHGKYQENSLTALL